MTNIKLITDEISEDMYSLEDIIKIFYYPGVNKFGLWKDLLEEMKTLLLVDIGLTVYSLHKKISFIINSYKGSLPAEINSQLKVIQLQNYLFSINEILNYIKPLIDDLTAKCLKKKYCAKY